MTVQSTAATPPLTVPDQDLVRQLLDAMEINHGVDGQGDLVASWEGFNVFFLFSGEEQEVFSMRGFHSESYPLDRRGEVVATADDWNRDTLWPKAFTHDYEGSVQFVTEAQTIIGTGVGTDHFVVSFAAWLQGTLQFREWIATRLDAAGSGPGAEAGG
ncbi:YbjN domain-containing protein [Streptomyces sp. NPDC058548]|uniref:YbjN domain-containing protein n=1 Tax=unclassified Streptomyces TaxID=2593676 RepID=UPI0036604C3E